MNHTVKRIVELLFQDAAPSAEIDALQDEVMTNCQEHFADLVARGATEDEAIAAVVESLRGMEEVIASYPRRETPAVDLFSGNEFQPSGLRRLEVDVSSADVRVEVSQDGRFHADKQDGVSTVLDLVQEGDTLRVSQHSRLTDGEDRIQPKNGKAYISLNWKGEKHEWRADTWQDLVRQIKSTLQNAFGSEGGSPRVTLRVPAEQFESAQIRARSGDLFWDGVCPHHLRAESASGDIEVYVPEGHQLQEAVVKSVSGDIRAELATASAEVTSTSGDICLHGTLPVLQLSTISGDAEVETESAEHLQLNTVSGDADVYVRHGEAFELNCKTTSGDLSVRLPQQLQAADVRMKSVSGDVLWNRVAQDDSSPVKISASSVSGDVTVSR